MKDQNTPTNTLNPIVIELQRIFDQFNDGELIDQPLSQGEAIHRIESLISEAVNKARISELKQLEPPEQYEEYAKLMGKEFCTICGFNAIEFRKHIAKRIKELETPNQVEGEDK